MALTRVLRSIAFAVAILFATAAPACALSGRVEGSVSGRYAPPSSAKSLIRAQSVTGPDSYENDDTFAGASTLVPGVVSGVHNFYNASPPAETNGAHDVDYAKFTATAGRTYRISTTYVGMPVDTWWSSPMELVANDGGGWGGYGTLQVYSEYEDGMDASNSKICWTCPATGTYYVRVTDWYHEYPDTQYTLLLEDMGSVAPGAVGRIGGADRYEVAAALAKNSSDTYAGVTKFVVASGLDKSMADALSASGLAGALNAPVILVRGDRAYLPAATKAAIQGAVAANPGATIQFHIVGGAASVPVALERQLKAAASNKATIQRIAGADRYAVAANVAADIRKHVPSYLLTAFVTNGQNATYFSDALAASPAAAQLGTPILLVKSTAVPAATAAALKFYPNRVLVGTPDKAIYANSVGKAVLGADFSKGVWITGSSRDSIARHFAEFWEHQGWSEMPVTNHYTTANMLSDALTAGSSPRLRGNYILYVGKDLTSDGTVSYASDQFIQVHRLGQPQLTIIGGNGSVDVSVENRLKYLVGATQPAVPPGPDLPIPAALWQPPAGSTPATGSYIYLDSDTGDYIGLGGKYLYTRSNATLDVSVSGGHLSVGVAGWNGDFQAMNTISSLQPGYYPGLARYPFHDPSKGGLSWYGQGRGSNGLTGWFAIDKVTYTGGVLTAIDLRFEQHSEGGVPALHGAIHWTASDPTPPAAGPVVPIPGTLWQPPAGSTPATGSYIYLNSDPGDYIGAGRAYLYRRANSAITMTASGGHLDVGVSGDQSWHGSFQAMNTISSLQPGYYPGLGRYPFHDATKGGLDWTGEGRGSNALTGWFAIDNVTYVNGVLDSIDLRFELHSEGGAPALHGAIHWTAVEPAPPAGPVVPVPDTLWQPPAGSTPATGNYVYLDSDPGDYVGGGVKYLYTPSTIPITVTATGGHLHVWINGSQWWIGDFQTMNTISTLQAGYYPDLQRYPFNNPAKGGLDWSGQGRGSNTLTGWFAIDNVTYTGGVLSSIDLRFEQHSEGGVSALHGAIHWTQ
jgi:putative cell wall-binding protein